MEQDKTLGDLYLPLGLKKKFHFVNSGASNRQGERGAG